MLSTAVWLGLKPDTRKTIAVMLEMRKSGGTEVVDGRVVTDGYTPTDLLAVDLPMLQTFMSSHETDFYKLFYELVSRVEEPAKEFPATTGKKRFCEHCDSEGVRHCKGCTRNQ